MLFPCFETTPGLELAQCWANKANCQDVEMPPGECCQENLIRALASDPASEQCNNTGAELNRITQVNGLDYIFNTYDIDALLVSMEVGYMEMYFAAAGYPAVSQHTPRLCQGLAKRTGFHCI